MLFLTTCIEGIFDFAQIEVAIFFTENLKSTPLKENVVKQPFPHQMP